MKARIRRALRRAGQFARRRLSGAPAADGKGVSSYWTSHNVTDHKTFASAEESLAYFHWRNAQYFNYLSLMPVSGVDGSVVLDFGCGPGNDLVGFGSYSRPARLIGMDVSPASLVQARARLRLHGILAELHQLDPESIRLPFESESVDYVHSSGVIHHVPDDYAVLTELRRVLKPGGQMRIMVYNYASLWLHLYVAYARRIVEGIDADRDLLDAFKRSTDGPYCPIARAYKADVFIALARSCGLACRLEGVAVSCWEMKQLTSRFDAIMDLRLAAEHREFLAGLRFDDRGLPLTGDHHAGIDACFVLERA